MSDNMTNIGLLESGGLRRSGICGSRRNLCSSDVERVRSDAADINVVTRHCHVPVTSVEPSFKLLLLFLTIDLMLVFRRKVLSHCTSQASIPPCQV